LRERYEDLGLREQALVAGEKGQWRELTLATPLPTLSHRGRGLWSFVLNLENPKWRE
jgi:hypothetical protein